MNRAEIEQEEEARERARWRVRRQILVRQALLGVAAVVVLVFILGVWAKITGR